MLSRRTVWLALGAFCALFHGACGSDDKSPPRPAASAGRSAQSGEGGESGADDGGSSGRAGAGLGGGAGAAGSGTGGRGAAGSAGSSGAGGARNCTAIEDIPTPVQTSLDAAPACTAESACGGDVDGTSFSYLDVCVDQDVVFAETYAECPGSQLNGIGDTALSGSVSFEGGVMTHRATIAGTGVFQIPVECHSCNCKDFQEVTLYNMGVTSFCYEDCYPDYSCRCLNDFEIEVDESEAYFASGSTVTTDSGRTYDYCASEEGLSLTETGQSPRLPGTASLVPPSELETPEICDGIDNDNNGTVDDDPVDCPPACNRQGVCAEVVETCLGAWVCEYTSDRYEPGTETECDGLDNDCDGMVDEDLTGCVEICDGLDNDNDNMIDDDPVDEGCPVGRGVCADGVVATCEGESGWRCEYTASSEYSAVETECDGLDNDCNGMVDEGCTCSTGTSKVFVLRKGMADAGIVRANLDGSNPELILPIPQLYVFDIAVDPVNEKLYFYDFGAEALQRVNLDGTQMEPVWSGRTQMFAIDPAAPGRGFVENDISTIRSFTFDAPTDIVTIIPTASVVAFAVDPVNQHLYWSDHSGTWPNGVMRANFDGSDPVGIFGTPIYYPGPLTVDPVNRRLYYNDGLGTHSVTLTGEDDRLDLPVSGQNAAPVDVALDLVGGKIYASEEGSDTVRRANLDGSNPEPIMSGAVVEAPEAIALYICAP